MGAADGVAKRCVICGADCAGQPRVKDPAGHYYCKGCHEQAMAKRVSPAAAAIAAPAEGAAFNLLADLAEQARPDAAIHWPCPSCGHALPAEAVLCANCGFDVRLGKAHAVRAVAAPVDTGVSPWFLWPVDALVRPGAFYRALLESATGSGALLVMAWIYGMSAVANRLDAMHLEAPGPGRSAMLADAWGSHWLAIVIGGLFSGAILTVIGGWWYGLRLRFAGVRKLESGQARSMYLGSGLIVAIPHLLCAAAVTSSHAAPSEAFGPGFSLLDAVFWVFLGLSVVSSFLGVRAVFGPSTMLAAIWFLVLPLVTYAIIFAAVMAVAAMASARGLFTVAAGADVANTGMYYCENFTFQHPGNWRIDMNDPDFDPHADIRVDSPLSGSVHIQMVNYGRSAVADELDRDLRRLRRVLANPTDEAAFTQWGSFTGQGRVLKGLNQGKQFEFRAFVARLDGGWILHVAESCAVSQLEDVRPGFELIQRTFRSTAVAPTAVPRPGPQR